jgi:hypothetical protein
MIWMLLPLGWVLASITILFGVHGFLKAEDERIAELDRRSERARQRVEREMRPLAEIQAEQAAFAAQARAMQNAPISGYSGLAWAQQNALMGQSQNMLGQSAGSNFGLLGPSLNSLFR